MAIEKMKKLRLLAVRDSKEELLKELIRHGCVEFSEAEDALADSEAAALVHPESSELSKLKAQHQTLVHAINLLDTYAPKKTKLLSAKPELEDRVLLDDTGLAGALRTAETLEGYDARIKRIGAEESRLRSVIESLQPWLSLDLPLNFECTERCSTVTGSIPARFSMETVSAAIEAVDECCGLAACEGVLRLRKFHTAVADELLEQLLLAVADSQQPELFHLYNGHLSCSLSFPQLS
jgi:V/A-type H+-transporting ATPase subunit I